MSATEHSRKFPGAFRKWIVTLWVMFLSFCSIFSAHVCLYALPDKTTKPFVGGVFCLFGAFTLMAYFMLEWSKGRDIGIKLIAEAAQHDGIMVVRESVAVHILKWIISIFLFLYAVFSALATLNCIFLLQDQEAQPLAALLYLSSAVIVIGALVFTVWKKWSAP